MKKKLNLAKLNTSEKRQDVKTLAPGLGCSCGTKYVTLAGIFKLAT